MKFLILLLLAMGTKCQQSAQYLQNAVRDLSYLRQLNVQSLRRADVAMASADKRASSENHHTLGKKYDENEEHVPPLTLTKGELAALYETAVKKGETLKLDVGDDTYVHAAVHELDGHDSGHHYGTPNHGSETNQDDTSAYYYYYYPIKSFIDEMTSQAGSTHEYTYKPKPKHHHLTTEKPHYQFHSHHHQHNITINKSMQEEKKNKLEPLFMAISGFIGMAIMFLFSAIIMPKFSQKYKKTLVKKDDDLDDFARLAINALDGECAERFACELSKTARNFNFQDNRFIKLLKRIAPGTFGKHIEKIGKYTTKHLKCTAIPCKKKNNNNNNNKNNNNNRNNNKNQNQKQKNQKKKQPAQKKH